MSGSQSPEVLKPILMRSSTPSHDEKVLLYLEGMHLAGAPGSSAAGSRPQSKYIQHDIMDAPTPNPNAWKPMSPGAVSSPLRELHSPFPKASGETTQLEDLAHSEMSYPPQAVQQGDDAKSTVQEGARTPSINSHIGLPREPGPEDEPGPHYISYGSGPSFGNFGPLPRSSLDMYGVPLPPPHPRTPALAAGIPLPFSPKSASSNIHIDVEPPSDLDLSARGISRADSRQSHRSDVTQKTPATQFHAPPAAPVGMPDPLFGITVNVGEHGTTIHVPSHSRGVSPVASPVPAPFQYAPSINGAEERPLSPASVHSRPQTTARSQSKSPVPVPSAAPTYHPPLPASKAGSDSANLFSPEHQYQSFGPLYAGQPSSPFKAPSKTPSRAPSKAPSMVDTNFASGRPFGSSKPESRQPTNNESPDKEMSMQGSDMNGVHPVTSINVGGSAFGGSAFGPPRSSAEPVQVYSPPLSPVSQNRPGMAGSVAGSNRPLSPARSQQTNGQNGMWSPRQNIRSRVLSPQLSNTGRSQLSNGLPVRPYDPEVTPTQSRVQSPNPTDLMEDYETEIIQGLLNGKTPRTSIAPSALADQVNRSHYHDQDLCILLHAADDPMTHDIVRKAVRKAVSARLKKLNMKHDKDSIRAYRKSFHDHDPSWHQQNPQTIDSAAPEWAKSLLDKLSLMEERVAELGPKIESLKSTESSRAGRSHSHRTKSSRLARTASETIPDEYEQQSQMTPIPEGMTETNAESLYHPPDTEFTSRTHDPTTMHGSMYPLDSSAVGTPVPDDEFEDENETQGPNGRGYTIDGDSRRYGDLSNDRGDSPGRQYLEEELYKLRIRQPSQSAPTHRSWEIAREDGDEGDDNDLDDRRAVTESELPEISGDPAMGYEDRRKSSPPLPPLPAEAHDTSASQAPNPWGLDGWNQGPPSAPAWQRIHQRLLNWAIVWPISELDAALNSTLRGFQVDEVALSIWSTQQYKRYVRNQLTEVPPGRVDRLFVPPNMADAINNAVFHGRHGDACSMLRDLWASSGLEGLPRLIIVLCKHRADPNHWVAHKFSLPDGTLTTYDTYPEKCLPDGRPLGWWFAIRIAWPAAMYPSPDHLMQKMVRLHRPMQLAIDNSVAAAGIWRNLLMSSRPERPLDLERLRDLINTEVKNLRQRKEQGKLSVSAARANWDELGI